ncbi:MAG TPA: serine protease [Planctomycetaceae bacterium]|nr:serine protease [Planctomycetaceae bacterium]
MRRIFLLIIVLACLPPELRAQSVCLPLPRLLTTMPMGGTVGTQIEVTISCQNVEDPDELLFTHPGITATQKLDANGQPEANKYIVTIAADCPPGIHEARIMSRLGISSSRVFCVDTLPEVVRTTPNTSLATAMELKVNSICNAVMTTKAVDHYWFDAIKGHRYIVNCAARGIDSKLDAVLIIGDSAGRDLVVERRGGTLDFTATEDGRHTIKVHELTFKGGGEYFYRLSLQEIAADAPIPQFASTETVNSFSWPPAGLALNAESQEVEPNNAQDQAQKITLPCDISGSFFPAADVDRFEFTATKGDVWWVEVASERLGRPTDPSVIVQRVSGEGAEQKLTDVAEFSDIAPPIKPSSNGYAYDGPPYDGGSADIIGKLEIKEDGVHRLQLTDLFGGTRNDPRNVYRLIIRKAAPDFAVAAWGLHMELRNGDRNALSKPLALRGGITVALEVVAVRRDGFDGDIELVMEGLPEGVTAQGLKIPKGKTRGSMLVTADQNAPRALANAKFYAKSTLNDSEAIRPVHVATHAWPIVDSWSEVPRPRLVTGLPVSVSGSEFSPISIAASEKKIWEVTAGEKLTIPLVQTRRSEFSGTVLQLKTSGEGFEGNPRFDLSLTADTSEAVLDTAALKTPPGDYLIAFYGSVVAKYRYNPEAVTVAEASHKKAVEDATVAAAEVQRLTEETAAAASEKKAEADAALAEAAAKKQTADAAVTAAAAKLKAATDTATPKDTADIVLSEPIAIKVK